MKSLMLAAVLLLGGVADAKQSNEIRIAKAALKEAQKKDKAERAKERLVKAEESVQKAKERLEDATEKVNTLRAEAGLASK